jgi:hypothetical protein
MDEEADKYWSAQDRVLIKDPGLEHLVSLPLEEQWDEQQAYDQKHDAEIRERPTQWRERIETVDDEEALNLPVYPEHEDELESIRREGKTLVPKDSASDAGGWVAVDALMKLFRGLTGVARWKRQRLEVQGRK